MTQINRSNGSTDLFANRAVPDVSRPLKERLAADIENAGGILAKDPEVEGTIGTTMFDLPGSEDNTVTVLLPKESAQKAASQSLVRVKSRQHGDGKSYLGIVTAGPFAEPDSVRADSHLLVTVATRGGSYQAPYHGRVQVTILGEELADGSVSPPRLRPLPNSLVYALSDEESAKVLKAAGDIRLGMVVGYKNVVVGIPSDQKSVLPRHTAVLGTTGGGKSTTIARLVQQAQAANMAVVLLDVEGEYTHLHQPTSNQRMLSALADRELKPEGIPAEKMSVYHLVGRETANPQHPNRRQFSLQFAMLSPYAASEILGLNDVQQTRFLRAYDITKEVMRDLGIFPTEKNAEQERLAMEVDEFERGYPRMTLSMIIDVAGMCLQIAESPKKESKEREPEQKIEYVAYTQAFRSDNAKSTIRKHIHAGTRPDSAVSWRALLNRLHRLRRLNVFDSSVRGVEPMIYSRLLAPGSVSVIDLSGSGMSELNNIVIADILRGIQDAQDKAYESYEKAKRESRESVAPTRTLIVIEEAHEFSSAERIDKMSTLFEQTARIAKRGRKRWLGLVFVTQLPQHLPRQIFGLVNSYVLHKITDPQIVAELKKTVSGIDPSLWNKLPALAPGQAIVSFPHMGRPLLVAVDPASAELRLVD